MKKNVAHTHEMCKLPFRKRQQAYGKNKTQQNKTMRMQREKKTSHQLNWNAWFAVFFCSLSHLFYVQINITHQISVWSVFACANFFYVMQFCVCIRARIFLWSIVNESRPPLYIRPSTVNQLSLFCACTF